MNRSLLLLQPLYPGRAIWRPRCRLISRPVDAAAAAEKCPRGSPRCRLREKEKEGERGGVEGIAVCSDPTEIRRLVELSATHTRTLSLLHNTAGIPRAKVTKTPRREKQDQVMRARPQPACPKWSNPAIGSYIIEYSMPTAAGGLPQCREIRLYQAARVASARG